MSAAVRRDCPTLQTARLTLSAFALDDFADFAAMWADESVVRHISGQPLAREDAWGRLLRNAGLWPMLGFGYWTLRERDGGRWVGQAGLAEFRREIEPSVEGTPEAGWALARWAHGRGLALEAMRAILDWSDQTLRAPRITCLIDPQNAPSLALADKLGFKPFARTRYKDGASVLLERWLA